MRLREQPKTTAQGVTMNAARETYIVTIQTLTIDSLLTELENSAVRNSYGSHDDQISLIRAEIKSRLS